MTNQQTQYAIASWDCDDRDISISEERYATLEEANRALWEMSGTEEEFAVPNGDEGLVEIRSDGRMWFGNEEWTTAVVRV